MPLHRFFLGNQLRTLTRFDVFLEVCLDPVRAFDAPSSRLPLAAGNLLLDDCYDPTFFADPTGPMPEVEWWQFGSLPGDGFGGCQGARWGVMVSALL